MSRVTYNEWDSPEAQWAGIRLAGATKQAINGKRGQAVLRELETALLAMSQKRLQRDVLYEDGEVCVLAVLALHRGVPVSTLQAPNSDETVEFGERELGLTYTLS